MLRFVQRYFNWYLWLGIYAAAIGALTGLLCFFVPFIPIVILLFPRMLLAALVFAAPLNLLLLPVVFHAVRHHARRRARLTFAGLFGGFVSPAVAAVIWGYFDPQGPYGWLPASGGLDFRDRWAGIAIFSVVGSIAGMVCARVFDKHGDKPSIFDVNAALDAARRQG